MSFISGVFTNYIVPTATSRNVVVGAGCLGAIPALEMATCAIQDLNGVLEHNRVPKAETDVQKTNRLKHQEQLKNTLIIRGLGALILGACALNQFPGSGTVGLVGYLGYARFTWKHELDKTHPCLTTFFTGSVLFVLSGYKKQIAKSIGSAVILTVSTVSSFLYRRTLQVIHLCRTIIHAVRTVAKGVVTAISVPFKLVGNILKAFSPFIRHPRLGIGALIGVGLIFGCVKYGHHLTGAAAITARLIHQSLKGLIYAGSWLVRGIGKVAKPLGKVLYFIPGVLIKTVQVIGSVFNVILHPLKAVGLAKAKPA